jgi:hypothetical protein
MPLPRVPVREPGSKTTVIPSTVICPVCQGAKRLGRGSYDAPWMKNETHLHGPRALARWEPAGRCGEPQAGGRAGRPCQDGDAGVQPEVAGGDVLAPVHGPRQVARHCLPATEARASTTSTSGMAGRRSTPIQSIFECPPRRSFFESWTNEGADGRRPGRPGRSGAGTRARPRDAS